MNKNIAPIKVVLCISCLLLFSCEAIFVEDISERNVQLIAPTNNTTVKEGEVVFTWSRVDEAVSYQLQVAAPSFAVASQILVDEELEETSIMKNISAGEYEWRVRAKNSDYQTEFTTFAFTASNSDISNIEAVLVSPEADAILNTASHELKWEAVQDATDYRLQIWKPDDQGTKIEDVTISATDYTHEFEDGEFTWRVRPQSNTQNGKYGIRKLVVDTVAPNKPENTSPENNEVQTETSIDFSWARTDISGTQEIDSIYVFNDVNLTQLSFKDKGVNKSFSKNDLEANTYYWYIKSFDEAGNESEKSSTFLVTIN